MATAGHGVSWRVTSVPGIANHQPAADRGPVPSTSVRIDNPAGCDVSAESEAAIRQIADVRCHLEICAQTLREHEMTFRASLEEGRPFATGMSPIMIRTLAACLSELLKLEWAQPHRDSCHDLCKLLDCPQQPVLRKAIEHSIEVLEATKFRFKSKELKRLREDLETLLRNSEDYLPSQTH